jgi:PAS domain S-box-containing protein
VRQPEIEQEPPLAALVGAALGPAPVSALVADARGGIVSANPSACALLGRVEETLLGSAYDNLVHPLDREAEAEQTRQLLEGARSSYRSRRRITGGDGRWVDAQVVAWLVGEPPEQEIARLIEPYGEPPEDVGSLALQLILDDLDEGVVVADTNGRLVLFNPKAEDILGMGPVGSGPEGWPSRFVCFLPDAVTPYPLEDLPLARALRGEPVDEAEIFIRNPRRPDGLWLITTARPIRDQAGQLRGAVVVFRDLTERRRAVEAMESSEARKAAVLASIAEGVAITDPAGLVTLVNPALAAMAGVSLDEVRGRPVSEAFPIFDAKCRPMCGAEDFLTRAIQTRQVVTNHGYAHTLRTSGGSRIPVALTAAPVLDESGTLLGGVQTIRDVSHGDVDQLNSTLVSTVSHELRTPLAIIVGYSEILLNREVDEAKRREGLERINGSAKRLSRLIDSLLSVSKIESGRLVVRPKPLDLATVVEEVVTPIARQRDVVVGIPNDLPPVLADRDMLVQILTNLVTNAVKYSESEVTVTATADGEAISVTVADQGVGMSEPELLQLFGRFFRSERAEVRKVEGNGLGLFITKNLVELLGGEIRVDSVLDEGTRFQIRLPQAPAESTPAP